MPTGLPGHQRGHMPQRQPMQDLVVIVPGITGSALALRKKPVWSLSGRAITRGVITLGRNVKHLRLPDGFGDSLPVQPGQGEPDDGVCATGLMGDLHVIPGVWSPIKGYSQLVRYFEDQFTATQTSPDQPGNLVQFAYDWRLSNVVSARRLAKTAETALKQWQEHSNNPDAKLVLVCHSMGGLVARWFLEKEAGWEKTRWLITVGTPYQGSMMSVDALSNGLSKGLGPFQVNLTELVQSFPSMYELLPTYECYDPGSGKLQRLTDTSGLGLSTKMVDSAAKFHTLLAEAVASRPDRAYNTMAIKGVGQPTYQTGRARAHGVELLQSRDGVDYGGDGTVPRPSAHPPEWELETSGDTIGYSQR